MGDGVFDAEGVRASIAMQTDYMNKNIPKAMKTLNFLVIGAILIESKTKAKPSIPK